MTSSGLRSWLTQQDMTVKEFASRLGYARPHVSNVLNGAEPVTDGFIGRFSKVFGFAAAAEVFGAAPEPTTQEP
jgi:plasmid maintenance system antidote protein VapI